MASSVPMQQTPYTPYTNRLVPLHKHSHAIANELSRPCSVGFERLFKLNDTIQNSHKLVLNYNHVKIVIIVAFICFDQLIRNSFQHSIQNRETLTQPR